MIFLQYRKKTKTLITSEAVTKTAETVMKHKLFPGQLYLQVFKQPWVEV